MEEIKKDVKRIKEDVFDIKLDLREHMRRTEILEKEVLPISKFVFSLKVLGALTGFAISVYGAYYKFFF